MQIPTLDNEGDEFSFAFSKALLQDQACFVSQLPWECCLWIMPSSWLSNGMFSMQRCSAMCLLMHNRAARAEEIFHSCICLYKAGCMSVLLLLFCVADHTSYVSFGFCATSFQLIVTNLTYLFHLPVRFFFLLIGGSSSMQIFLFEPCFLKLDILYFSKPLTGCFLSELSIASNVQLF